MARSPSFAPLFAPRWLALHALAAILVAVFLALGWWQVGRAAAGNVLSYAYAVEWPVFAAFVVALWAREVRMQVRPPAADQSAADQQAADQSAALPEPSARPSVAGHIPFSAAVQRRVQPTDEAGPELAAYNAYLAWLAADPQRRPDDYPKGSP